MFDGCLGGQACHPELCRFLLNALHFRGAFVVAGRLADQSPGQVKTCPGVQDREFAILLDGAGQVHRGSRRLPGGQEGESDVAVLNLGLAGRGTRRAAGDRLVADGPPVGCPVPGLCALGFPQATGGDVVFRQLVLARIIEPASKQDSLRVLEEAGAPAPSYPTLSRRLSA